MKKAGWLSRLKSGLSRSAGALGTGISDIFTTRKLDNAALDELTDLLITSDLGFETASQVTSDLAKDRFDQEITPDEVRRALAARIADILQPVALPLRIDAAAKPHVVLVVGVNGTGKTTTIGKLAAQYTADGKKVVLGAGDTFRAAAAEQLQVWGERAGALVISGKPGGDPAAVAFDTVKTAMAREFDVCIIDTAGRLQTKKPLMEELAKINRVLSRDLPEAPHECLLVLDANTGQNAISQAQLFTEVTDVTGLVLTKLDGTAKGGVIVGLADQFGIPVRYVGVGEAIGDLQEFRAEEFVGALFEED